MQVRCSRRPLVDSAHAADTAGIPASRQSADHVDLHIEVEPDVTVAAAHVIAGHVRRA